MKIEQPKEQIWKIGNRRLTDQEVVAAILCRDDVVTKTFFYVSCRPLFGAIFQRYYTDCSHVDELISEIYLYLLTPGVESGRSKLAGFGFRCTLATWLKVVTEHYCHKLYCRHVEVDENISVDSDRFDGNDTSLDLDTAALNSADVKKVLSMMTNRRYRLIIEYRYLQGLTNEETAQRLNMTMTNYYNKHKLAKEQFCMALRKEGLL